jgi:hypothetical protein
LWFDHHLADYQRMGLLSGNPETVAHFWAKAAYIHYLTVSQAVIELPDASIQLSSLLSAGSASDYMRYGVARRILTIRLALNDLYRVAPPDRRKPLGQDDVDVASRSLNDIYIHCLGVLDNYSHVIAHQLVPDQTALMHHRDFALFSPAFSRHLGSQQITAILDSYRDWYRLLKTLRDPVAHRIPLTVPPVVLQPDERLRYELAWDDWQREMAAPPPRTTSDYEQALDAWSERVGRLMQHMEQIGEFRPLISHDPRDAAVPIYPTVIDDVGTTLKLAQELNLFLQQVVASKRE